MPRGRKGKTTKFKRMNVRALSIFQKLGDKCASVFPGRKGQLTITPEPITSHLNPQTPLNVGYPNMDYDGMSSDTESEEDFDSWRVISLNGLKIKMVKVGSQAEVKCKEEIKRKLERRASRLSSDYKGKWAKIASSPIFSGLIDKRKSLENLYGVEKKFLNIHIA